MRKLALLPLLAGSAIAPPDCVHDEQAARRAFGVMDGFLAEYFGGAD